MRLVMCLVLALALGCGESPSLVGVEDNGAASLSKRAEAKMIPLKGDGTWVWEAAFLEPTERCVQAGGTHTTLYTEGTYYLTHLGLTSRYVDQCVDLTVNANVYALETLTAANGDQLVLIYTGRPLAELPPGWDLAWNFTVESGTGRFEGAVGEGTIYFTIAFEPPGARGEGYVDGVVSSVGTSQ